MQAAAKNGRTRLRRDSSSPGSSLKKPKKSPAGKKKRTSLSSAASPSPATRPAQKKMKKSAEDGVVSLESNDGDLRKRVAKEFNEGVFTGVVVEVKQSGAKGTLWKIE